MTLKADISPACEADIKKLCEIAESSFSDPWSEKIFMQTLSSPISEILLARTQNDDIAGYLVLSDCGDEKSVDDIAVAPDFRRMGVGKQLLLYAHQKYHDKNFLLEVRESNMPAITLYKSMGYRQVGFRKRYYHNPSEGAVLMTKYRKES